jgi:hypothetical protein
VGTKGRADRAEARERAKKKLDSRVREEEEKCQKYLANESKSWDDDLGMTGFIICKQQRKQQR